MVVEMSLRDLVPPGVAFATLAPAQADPDALCPEERALVAHAASKRRHEHAAGRSLARRLCAELGLTAMGPLLADEDDVPTWPEQVVGSISHCDTLCIVVVAKRGLARAIGVDVEPAAPLPNGIDGLVLFEPDREGLLSFRELPRPFAERLIFSAKEAAYKAIFPLARRTLEFDEMAVTAHPGGELRATLRTACPPFAAGERLGGRWALHEGHLVTAFTLLFDA